jgi:LysW-gamma-L-lysine carboxypeptidase
MTGVTDSGAIALLHQMLAISSPSGAEHELAAFLVPALAELGFSSRIDEAGNVIGDIGRGEGPTLMLLSHLDTVDRPLPVRRTATALHGRGAVDAKGPLAAMICAAARRPDFPGTIRVIGAVEEERLSRGGHHVARTLPQPDWLIIGEPSGWSSVVLGYKGKIDVEFRVQSPPTHSTNPAPKATELTVAFWLALREALGPDLDHGKFHVPAATLRRMEGDVLRAYLDVDCRVPPGFDVEAFTRALRLAAGQGSVEVIRHVPAARAARNNPVARCLTAGIRRCGGQPRPLLKTGTSDMNTVGVTWSVPMAAYGPGDSSLDHGDDEQLSIAEYLTAIEVLTSCADELAGEAATGSRRSQGGDDGLPAGRPGPFRPQRGRGIRPGSRHQRARRGGRGAAARLASRAVPAGAGPAPVHGPAPAQGGGADGRPGLVRERGTGRRRARR